MKKIFLIIFVLIVSSQVLWSAQFEVAVLPSSICQSSDNYYSFDNVDVILAKDIATGFNSSYKIRTTDVYDINSKLNSDSLLKTKVCSALEQYNSSKSINYRNLKSLSTALNVRSILIVSAISETFDGEVSKNVWQSLNISSAFDITQANTMKAEAVLLDNVNDLVMWSAMYEFPLSDKQGRFQAMNYAEAVEQLEKIKLFSKEILSRSVCQNVLLRFFPKSIRPIEMKTTGESIDSGLLKYNKNIPSMHNFGKERVQKKTDEFDENEYGEMIYGL